MQLTDRIREISKDSIASALYAACRVGYSIGSIPRAFESLTDIAKYSKATGDYYGTLKYFGSKIGDKAVRFAEYIVPFGSSYLRRH